MDTTRRALVVGSLASSALLSSSAPGSAAPVVAARRGLSTASHGGVKVSPFTLGVASGDPAPDGVVLWTRLAVDPLAADGRGGMPGRDIAVQWQVASDPGMRHLVDRGIAHARASAAHTVHVELHSLRPGREYWYRFRVGRHLSEIGRTRTTPAARELPASLTLAIASCSQYEHGYFTAYRHLAEDEPDVVVHLGDYQYEYAPQVYVSPSGNVRDHRGPETVDLAGYRQRYAQYRHDPDLQRAHAVAPWVLVWDDHEVDNNWASETPENTKAAEGNDTTAAFLRRRAAAFRAYYENMPLRRAALPSGPDMKIYRRSTWGRLLNLHLMDTRQYRDDQACGDGWDVDCAERLDPARSITGAEQERWLRRGFASSRARWDLLGQQVFFSERDRDPRGDRVSTSMDGWDGYVPSRERVVRSWVDAGVRNPVVLTGDVHRHWASDIKTDFADPHAPVVGSELVCSSITSGGDGDPGWSDPMLAWNPHLKFSADQRGYIRARLTPDDLRADFRSLTAVTRPDSPVRTQATFALTDGERGLQRVR